MFVNLSTFCEAKLRYVALVKGQYFIVAVDNCACRRLRKNGAVTEGNVTKVNVAVYNQADLKFAQACACDGHYVMSILLNTVFNDIAVHIGNYRPVASNTIARNCTNVRRTKFSPCGENTARRNVEICHKFKANKVLLLVGEDDGSLVPCIVPNVIGNVFKLVNRRVFCEAKRRCITAILGHFYTLVTVYNGIFRSGYVRFGRSIISRRSDVCIIVNVRTEVGVCNVYVQCIVEGKCKQIALTRVFYVHFEVILRICRKVGRNFTFFVVNGNARICIVFAIRALIIIRIVGVVNHKLQLVYAYQNKVRLTNPNGHKYTRTACCRCRSVFTQREFYNPMVEGTNLCNVFGD